MYCGHMTHQWIVFLIWKWSDRYGWVGRELVGQRKYFQLMVYVATFLKWKVQNTYDPQNVWSYTIRDS